MVKARDLRLPPAVHKVAESALTATWRYGGLAGDSGEACVALLRVFDPGDHDVACKCPEPTGFLKFLDEMFLHGRAFDDVQHRDDAAPNKGIRNSSRQDRARGGPGGVDRQL